MATRYWQRSVACTLLFLLILAGCAAPLSTSVPRIEAPLPGAHLQTSGVILLQSDDSLAYARVTREILRQWRGDLEILHLNSNGELSPDVRRQVQASTKKRVVAVGLAAAREAATLTGKKVVFCQVFNHEEHDLVRPWMKGVSALPPVTQQFRAWKELDPRLRSIAVIVGPGLRTLLSEAQVAARENGIKLRYVRVNSDIALRHANEQLGPEVQGLWLVPDNRVLSTEVLRDVFAISGSRGRQVMVTNEQFLSWGATLSVESDYADVANQALARLAESAGSMSIPGPDIAPLTKAAIKTNAERVRHFGLAAARQFHSNAR